MKHFVLVVLVLGFCALGAGIDDYLSEMKATKEQVRSYIQESCGYGSLSYPGACARIPMARRAGLVRAVGEFARQFTSTEAFRIWYNGFRDDHKPSPPDEMKSMDDSRNEQVTAIKAQIAEQEKAAKSAPASQKAMYEQIIGTMKQALKEIERSDKTKDADANAYIQQANAAAKEEYAKKLADWEAEYPAGNPRPLLKKRLQAFLEATSDIDFSAKLVKKGKVMVFENKAYEEKSSSWKLAYRAGKEAVQTARTIAQEWQKAL
jgi:hypothetical protein